MTFTFDGKQAKFPSKWQFSTLVFMFKRRRCSPVTSEPPSDISRDIPDRSWCQEMYFWITITFMRGEFEYGSDMKAGNICRESWVGRRRRIYMSRLTRRQLVIERGEALQISMICVNDARILPMECESITFKGSQTFYDVIYGHIPNGMKKVSSLPTEMENKKPWKLYENILEKIMWKIYLLLDTPSRIPDMFTFIIAMEWRRKPQAKGPSSMHAYTDSHCLFVAWSMDVILRFRKSSLPFFSLPFAAEIIFMMGHT